MEEQRIFPGENVRHAVTVRSDWAEATSRCQRHGGVISGVVNVRKLMNRRLAG